MDMIKHFVAYVVILIMIVSLVGCSNKKEEMKDYIKVEKRVGTSTDYEPLRKVVDEEKVQQILTISQKAQWESAKITTLEPANYQYYIANEDPKVSLKVVLYRVWNSKGNNKLMLARDNNEFAQLDEENSKLLYKLLVGK